MGEPIGPFNRVEDRKWFESVETRLVSLTSAQKQTDDDLDKQEARLDLLDDLLEGRPEDKNDNGLKGDIHDLAVGLKKLEVILAPDHLGEGGYNGRLKAVERALGIKEKNSDNRWRFGTVVASSTLAGVVAIITALLAIEPVRHAIGQKIETYIAAHDKKPSKKAAVKRRPARRPAPPPAQEADDGRQPAEKDVPE